MQSFSRWVAAGTVAVCAAGICQGQVARPTTGAPATAPAQAKAQAPAAAPIDKETLELQRRQVDQLLLLWEQQSARLNTLDVGFDRIDSSVAWGDEKFKGRAYFQAPNLACIHTQKVDGKALINQERIVCTGKDVYQYNYETKQIFIFPLDKDQRKKALEEGPLPFLFNMKADEAKQRYQMQLLNQNERAYLISVLPLLKEDRQVFSTAFLQLDKKTFLPDRLLLVSPNGKDKQDYQFSGVAANQPVNAAFFKGSRIEGWKEIFNPTPEQMQQAVDQGRGGRPTGPAGAAGAVGVQPQPKTQQPAVGRDTRGMPRR